MNAMLRIRPPAVAGLFYPEDAAALREMVVGFLREFAENGRDVFDPIWPDSAPKAVLKALIAPHAGFIYSGAIAASAYGRLSEADTHIERVVLLGPSHHVRFSGVAVTSADFYGTPMGNIALDRGAMAELAGLSQVVVLEEAHAPEHSLEVHLPFLREVLGDFMLAPLVVGEARPEEVAEVLGRLWGGAETLIVVSTDLSHYLGYEEGRERDRVTAEAIERLDVRGIHSEDACGRNPVNGLLYVAKERRMRVERLDLRSSGDTAGDKGRVVGYGAWAFFERGEEGEAA